MTATAAARRAAALGVTVVTAVAAAALVTGAVHGVRTAASLASDRSVASAELDDAYYACLATQVRSLVRPGQVVDLSQSDPGPWVTLAKAVLTENPVTADPSSAVAVLSLRELFDPEEAGSCLGSVVVARFPARGGHPAVVRVGSGASLTGPAPPPTPPL